MIRGTLLIVGTAVSIFFNRVVYWRRGSIIYDVFFLSVSVFSMHICGAIRIICTFFYLHCKIVTKTNLTNVSTSFLNSVDYDVQLLVATGRCMTCHSGGTLGPLENLRRRVSPNVNASPSPRSLSNNPQSTQDTAQLRIKTTPKYE